ncbi:hypothetical protein HY478_02430 [Candidatus Uhrbacteria bacterium]|nr:hypothetical protein [Candidatus Uhrbacteria bacterium]
MSHKRLLVAAVIIASFIFINFLFSVPRAGDIPRAPAFALEESTKVPSVVLRDVFKKGTHTISGSIEVPDACSSVTATAILVGEASAPEGIQVIIAFSPDSGVCLELPTRVDFSTDINAPAGLPITATVNGMLASTTAL